jgi:hypothetical protein
MHQRSKARVRRRALGLVAALAASVTVGLVAAPSSGAASDNTLTVTAGEYVYQLKGSPKPGMVTINFKNGGTEYHMLQILALKPGVTLAQVKTAVASEDENAGNDLVDTSVGVEGNITGGPDLIGPQQATTTTTQVPAGHYALLCFIAAPDGKPHAAHGMVKVFDIKGAKSRAKAPSTQATVTLKDDGIDFPLTNPGHNVSLKVTNSGTAPHNFTLVKLESGKTIDDAKTYFNGLFSGQAPAGQPPATIVGGVSTMAPGGTSYLQQTLTPGHYAYVSTEGEDPATDDSTKGLLGEFDVK